MANPVHCKTLTESVYRWNEWRRLHPSVKPDLSSSDLSGADLSAANLTRAILYGSNLTGAHLIRADLSEADLTESILSKADLNDANPKLATLKSADLTGANLRGALLCRTNLEKATLSECLVYGISVWDVRLDDAVQHNLVITPDDQPAIQVDNLEVAQFVYLLLNNKKIRDVIDTIGKKAVLLLGRFTPERKAVLDAMRDALRSSGYLPILFDFEKPTNRDLQETITTLAGLSRFIIADISDPKSIPQELAGIVQSLLSVPVQPLLQIGYEPWALYDHIERYRDSVLPLLTYHDQPTLLAELQEKVIAPAEAKAKALTAGI